MRARALGALATAAAGLAIAIPAFASGGAQIAGTHTVVLKSMRFHPSTITIKRGESVTWVWRDGSLAHNVTGKGFHSRTQSHGSFTERFTKRGTFKYVCTIHVALGMTGRVVVR